MRRSLVFSIAIVLSCLGAGTGAFYAGRTGGPDLAIVARNGSHAGVAAGSRAGVGAGTRAGYRVGYRTAFESAYPVAYRWAYRRALER